MYMGTAADYQCDLCVFRERARETYKDGKAYT